MTGEERAIHNSDLPRTFDSLCRDLAALGVQPGMTMIVHSALTRIGWVAGGAPVVVQALMAALTADGTLVMPTQTAGNSEPSRWQNPPVPEAWWPIIREHMPAYDPLLTSTRGMGAIVESFRTFPGVLRSAHPQLSLAAWGQHAKQVIEGHALEFALGEQSPLARLYDLHAHVLLIGVGHDNNTSLHLAEYRAPGAAEQMQSAAIMEHGQRVWRTFRDIELDADAFTDLGAAFEAKHPGLVRRGNIGSADSTLIPQRPLVDFSVNWITARRSRSPT